MNLTEEELQRILQKLDEEGDICVAGIEVRDLVSEIQSLHHEKRSTDVKDDKGREIYEGDALEIICDFELRKGTLVDTVVFENGCFFCNDWALFELVSNRKKGTQRFTLMKS